MIETPQILPSNLTPLYVLPTGVDHVLLDGQVVQALLDEEANNTVRVEDEVGAVCVLVADNAV